MTADKSVRPVKSGALRFRLSDGEFGCLCGAAIERGMDKSAWLLEEAAGPVAPDICGDPLEAARRARDDVDRACDQMARIANNCAQIDRFQLLVVKERPELARAFSALDSLQRAARLAKTEYGQLAAALGDECSKTEGKRTASFHVRVAPAEKELIEGRAASQGMTTSSFLRAVIRCGGRFPSPLDRAEIKKGHMKACCMARILDRDAQALNSLAHEVNRRAYGGDAMLPAIAEAIGGNEALFRFMGACFGTPDPDVEAAQGRGERYAHA